MFIVVRLELISFLVRTVATYRTHIKHSVSVFDKCASLFWDVKVSNIVETEVDKILQTVFTHEAFEILPLYQLAFRICIETILIEAVFSTVADWLSELFYNLLFVATRNYPEVYSFGTHLF